MNCLALAANEKLLNMTRLLAQVLVFTQVGCLLCSCYGVEQQADLKLSAECSLTTPGTITLRLSNFGDQDVWIRSGADRISLRYMLMMDGRPYGSGVIGGEHLGGRLREELKLPGKEVALSSRHPNDADYDYLLDYEVPNDLVEPLKKGADLSLVVALLVRDSTGKYIAVELASTLVKNREFEPVVPADNKSPTR